MTGTKVERSTFERFLAAADNDQSIATPDEIALDIIKRILDAQSVDDVLGGAGAIHSRDYLRKPFKLTDVRFNESSFEGDGPSFYGLLEGADPDGVKVVITCGARNVIAQAWKLKDMGALPVDVELAEASRETAAGFRPMWLEKATVSL